VVRRTQFVTVFPLCIPVSSLDCCAGEDRMIRVYQFILDHRIGGPHVYVDTLRKALVGKVESIIVTTSRGPMTDIALLNLRHLWTPLYALEIILNAIYLVGAVLLRRVERRGVVFNVHGGANLAPILAARIVGIPVVWHFHETTPQFRQLVSIGMLLLRGHPHSLVVVANKAKEAYRLRNAEFIPAAIDESFWSLAQVSAEEVELCGWGGDEDTEVRGRSSRILVVGNLNPLKGIDLLLEAIEKVDSTIWDVKIVGAELKTHREYAGRLYLRASEVIASKNKCAIDFLGWQDARKIRALLASCDVFILPSRSEACPIVLLEAIAMRCRCIVTNVGDVSEMLQGAVGSELITPDSSEALTIALNKMFLTEPLLVKNEGWLRNCYSVSKFSTSTYAIYEKNAGAWIR